MRTPNRTRSLSSILVWCVALLVMTGIAAWQFRWLPTSESTPAEQTTRPGFEHFSTADGSAGGTAGGAAGSRSGGHPGEARTLDEQAILARQSEPEVPGGSSGPPPFPTPSALPSPPPGHEGADANPPGYASLDGPTAHQPTEPRRLSDVSDFRPIDGPAPPIRVVSGGTADLAEAASSAKPTTSPTQPTASPAPGFSAAREQIANIDRLIESGGTADYIAAHKELSKLYWDHPEWRDALQSRIDKTAGSIYFSPQPHYMDPYEIQPDDQLARVATLYRVPWEFLATINRTDPRRIRPGQKLKVIKGPFGAVVDLQRFELTVEHHGFVVKRYPVAIGKDGSTPLGEFTVKNKLVNPTYYGPDGEVIDGDDLQNPLGEFWIDLGDSYGIHGTIEPDSIGKAASRGCVRMHNEAVEEVFRFLSIGSKVIIRR